MLEEMRSEYNRTNEAFQVITRAALSEIDCRANLKEELRKAAVNVEGMDWRVAIAAGLDTLFIEWLCGDKQAWLYSGDPIDHFLPRTMLDGVDYQLQSKDDKDSARGRARMSARDKRVNRAVEAVNGGWSAEGAISFVASKEEWEAVCDKAGIPRPMQHFRTTS